MGTKKFWGLCVFLSLLLPLTTAEAGSMGAPYVSLGVGYTIYDGLDDVSADPEDVDRLRINKNTTGYIAYGGWAFPNGYSLELSYGSFGEFDITSDDSDGVYKSNTKVTGEIDGTGIGVRHDWTFSESVDIYGRIGVMRWEAVWDVVTVIKPTDKVLKGDNDTNGTEFYLGVGAQYEIVRNVFLYAEGHYLDARFDQDGFDDKMPVYGLFGGVMVRFGGLGQRSAVRKSTGRDMTVCDPKYKDISGVACQ